MAPGGAGQEASPRAGCFPHLILSGTVQRHIGCVGPASSGVDAGSKLEAREWGATSSAHPISDSPVVQRGPVVEPGQPLRVAFLPGGMQASPGSECGPDAHGEGPAWSVLAACVRS